MEKLLHAIIIIIIAASGLCVVSSHAERRYHFIYEHKNLTEARSYCREHYTDLATVETLEDVNTLTAMANLSQMIYSSNNYRAWIGLYDDVNSWRWSLADAAFYKPEEADFKNWADGEPNNDRSVERCADMYGNGFWNDEDCEMPFSSVCSDCRGSNVTFVLVNTPMSWARAQNYCRTHYTDLASVRNMTENQKVAGLTPSGKKVWIGLFRDSWKWFDVVSHKRVVKVRLEKQSSSLNLNDPAVLGDILKQFEQKLMDKGLNGAVRLSWVTQSDGNVFHEEKKKKETLD
ncbi:hypothetical protein Q5P01_003132 [Channa striata]|uniref:C-type lectin domain-containing protein n=1 Tax=Channa striata TaxID=64152 RepID=A0AA88T8R8_CHASR|nr:hypothetical protein Q5P01_003132 [Channa striata]